MGGGIESITLYTSLSDVQNKGLRLNVDGVNVYARLGEISDSESSSLKCEFGGKVYGVLKTAGIKAGEITLDFYGDIGLTRSFIIPDGVKTVAAYSNTYPDNAYYIKVTSGKTYTLEKYSYKGGAFGKETRYGLQNYYSKTYWLGTGRFGFTSIRIEWSNAINDYSGNAATDY